MRLSILPLVLLTACTTQRAASALWVAPSLALHDALHEGSHALVGIATGDRVVRWEPYPSHTSRTFGLTVFERAPRQPALVAMAPAAAETLWMLGAAILYRNTHQSNEVLRGILLTEVATSAADLAWWYAGTARPGADAYAYRSTVVPAGAIILPVLAGLVAITLKSQ